MCYDIRRFIALEKQTELIIRLDSYEAAALLQAEAEKEGVTVPYTVIVVWQTHAKRSPFPWQSQAQFVLRQKRCSCRGEGC